MKRKRYSLTQNDEAVIVGRVIKEFMKIAAAQGLRRRLVFAIKVLFKRI